MESKVITTESKRKTRKINQPLHPANDGQKWCFGWNVTPMLHFWK